MDENQYWVAVWKTVATAFCMFVLTIAGCTVNSNLAVKQAIKDGADPIKAGCAINGVNSENIAVCTIAASK
jgi:hypothetical protein